jgi:hypothetical protein
MKYTLMTLSAQNLKKKKKSFKTNHAIPEHANLGMIPVHARYASWTCKRAKCLKHEKTLQKTSLHRE